MVRRTVMLLLLGLLLLPPAPAAEDIWVTSGSDAQQVYLRQPVLLWVDLYDDRSIVSKHAADWRPRGFSARFLGSRQWREQQQGKTYVVHRYQWALMPLAAGEFSLSPPPIEIRRLPGRAELGPLQAPPLQLQVNPLPSYLPAYLPVSGLSLESRLPQGEILTGAPAVWQLRIRGRGLTEGGMQRLLGEQLQAPGVRFYPPRLSLVPSGDAENPLLQELQVNIPLVAEQAGELALPALRLPHVDPASGRLAALQHPAQPLAVQSPLVLWLQRLGLGLLGIVLLLAVLVLARRIRAGWQAHGECRRALQAAADGLALRQRLRACGMDGMAPDLAAQVDAFCFAREPGETLERLREQALQKLDARGRRPWILRALRHGTEKTRP